ncbi:MAG: hypothetical protein U9P73_03305 [Candidatus Cloacimonadota bacterium]|nr:hypothetical protein [Candidatus Cloacimonadota bacterium]
MNHDIYAMCYNTAMQELLSIKGCDAVELMIFTQFLTLRLAYQAGINSNKLLKIVKLDDKKKKKDWGFAEEILQNYLSVRLDRFSLYEVDWKLFKSGEWVDIGPFVLARKTIYGHNSTHPNIYIPYITAVVASINRLECIIGELKDVEDEWEDDFMVLLEEYHDYL